MGSERCIRDRESIAKKVADILEGVEIFDVAKVDKSKISEYKNLILATPTYGAGDMQGDWEEFLETLKPEDFNDKIVALIGLGDQDTYADTFCDGLFPLYQIVSKAATIIGATKTDGYEYESSSIVVNGEFVGLILDEDNQEDLTEQRIKDWVKDIQDKFQ
ncbi:MAG: flavodoxin [Helicobacter sp.]|nr:flavodoxin [Helicobacter sp.]